MRYDPPRLDPPSYPWREEMPTRFSDLDTYGHLNNVAVANLYEEGRIRFSAQLRAAWAGGRVVVGRVAIDYLGEGRYPAPVTLCTGVLSIGGASYVYGQALFQNDACIGLAETVLVYTAEGRSARLPDAFREALSALIIDLRSPANA
jgi:acyl-CoA thioester hydrolase